MLEGPDTPALATVEPQLRAGPDWQQVPFPVGCARCGHDLRGLAEPKCPACGLDFDWSIAVPIEHLTCLHCGYHLYGLQETRCPECGNGFTWEEVLAEYRRRRKPLFEYQWRERPIRSLIATWWLALRPWKLWKAIEIHDPPRVRPLIIMTGLTLPGLWIAFVLWHVLGWSAGWTQTAPGVWRYEFDCSPRFVADAMRSPDVFIIFGSMVVWWITTLGALLLLRQSMRLCRVRTAHVVRVWAHSVLVTFPVTAIVVFVTACALILGSDLDLDLSLLISNVLSLVFVVWSIHLGYRDYIRMPHSLGVAIASQLISVLTTLTCSALLANLV